MGHAQYHFVKNAGLETKHSNKQCEVLHLKGSSQQGTKLQRHWPLSGLLEVRSVQETFDSGGWRGQVGDRAAQITALHSGIICTDFYFLTTDDL